MAKKKGGYYNVTTKVNILVKADDVGNMKDFLDRGIDLIGESSSEGVAVISVMPKGCAKVLELSENELKDRYMHFSCESDLVCFDTIEGTVFTVGDAHPEEICRSKSKPGFNYLNVTHIGNGFYIFNLKCIMYMVDTHEREAFKTSHRRIHVETSN